MSSLPLSTYFRATVNNDLTNIAMSCGNLYGFTRDQRVEMYHVCRPDVIYDGHIARVDKLFCTITIAEKEREACAAMLARVMEVRATVMHHAHHMCHTHHRGHSTPYNHSSSFFTFSQSSRRARDCGYAWKTVIQLLVRVCVCVCRCYRCSAIEKALLQYVGKSRTMVLTRYCDISIAGVSAF